MTWNLQRWKAFVWYRTQPDRCSHNPPNRSVFLVLTGPSDRIPDLVSCTSRRTFWSRLSFWPCRGFTPLFRAGVWILFLWPRLHPYPHCLDHRLGPLGNRQERPQGQRDQCWLRQCQLANPRCSYRPLHRVLHRRLWYFRKLQEKAIR